MRACAPTRYAPAALSPLLSFGSVEVRGVRSEVSLGLSLGVWEGLGCFDANVGCLGLLVRVRVSGRGRTRVRVRVSTSVGIVVRVVL